MRHPQPDLVAARIRGLAAEEDEVEETRRGLIGTDRVDDDGRRRVGIPFASIRPEMDRAVDPERHRVAQLLDRLGGTEGQDHRLAAVGFDQANRLLDSALLVRADREAEVLGLERHRVGGKHHLSAGERHAFHADEDPHERTRVFSGPKRGVGRTTATVTG